MQHNATYRIYYLFCLPVMSKNQRGYGARKTAKVGAKSCKKKWSKLIQVYVKLRLVWPKKDVF